MVAVADVTKTAKYINGGIYIDSVIGTNPGYANNVVPGYTGHDYINVSSISMGSIDILETTREVPFCIYASAKNVTCSGTRTYGVGSIDAFTMLEHHWTLTYSNGANIEWVLQDWLIDHRGQNTNPYTDIKSPIYSAPIRQPGTYTLRLTSRAPGIESTTTVLITANVPTYKHEWYDGLNGDDANDGLDPWGFGLTTASYTESTGVLSQTNAFTSYDHSAATTGSPTDWYNLIYISGGDVSAAGWHRISSKTDNSNIVLQDKLGADDTNVTSSDGAKQTFTGAARTASSGGSAGNATLDRHDVCVHLNGNGGSTSYAFTEAFSFALGHNSSAGWGDVHKFICGYNDSSGVRITGHADIASAGIRADVLLNVGVGGDGNLARYMGAWNLRLDGDNNAYGAIHGAIGDAFAPDNVVAFFDRIQTEKCTERNVSWNTASNTIASHALSLWKCDIDNTRQGHTLDTGTATGGSSTTCIDTGASWTVDEWVGNSVRNTTDGCVGEITSNTSTTLTVSLFAGGTNNDFENGDAYEIVYGKHTGAFISIVDAEDEDRLSVMGGSITTDSDSLILDHYLYPTYKHLGLFGYIRFYGGEYPSYCINTNYNAGSTNPYTAIIENRAEGNSDWFCDASGANNNPVTEGTFEDMLVARNAAKTKKGFMFCYSPGTVAVMDNLMYGDASATSTREFFNPNTVAADLVGADFLLHRNKGYGIGSFEYTQQTGNNGMMECTDNEFHSPETSAIVMRVDFDYLTNRVYDGNNFYSPSDSDGNAFYDFSDAATKSLATFNTAVGGTNTSTNPNWTDAPNGDFT